MHLACPSRLGKLGSPPDESGRIPELRALIAPLSLDFLRELRIKTPSKIYATFLSLSLAGRFLCWCGFIPSSLRGRPAFFRQYAVFGRNLWRRPGYWAARYRLVLGWRSRQRKSLY